MGCKYKTSLWHLNGFPDGSNIGSTVYYRGETHRYAVRHLKGFPDGSNIGSTVYYRGETHRYAVHSH